MVKCKHETKNGICEIHSSYSYCHLCDSENLCKGYEQKTNADRIRAMSDEELAKEMRSHAFALAACSEKAWLEWLKQPAE